MAVGCSHVAATILGARSTAERNMIMAEPSSPPHGSWFRAWCGLVVGVCVVLPVLLRLEHEGWTGVDVFLMLAGLALMIGWAAKLVSLGWVNRRRSQGKQYSDGSSSKQAH